MKRLALLFCLVATTFSGTRAAWAIFCNDCYEGVKQYGDQYYMDAMCCFSDGECGYIPEGYSEDISDSSWCYVGWVNKVGYMCSGESGSCKDGGGEGGGGVGGDDDACSIGPNDGCPAECESCERSPFLN